MWVRFVALMVALGSAGVARAECKFSEIATLPVTLQGPRPLIDAKINGREGRFVLDSGGFWSVISPGTAAAYGLKGGAAPGNMRMRGIGGSTAVALVTVKNLMLADVSVPNVQFLIGGSEVGGQAGVIGQNVLHVGDVEYDMPHGRVALFKAQGCGDKTLAYWATPEQPFSEVPLENNLSRVSHTQATILVNGQKLRAMFDTGAPNSSLSLRAAERLGIKLDGPGVVSAGYVSGFGSRQVPAYLVPVKEIVIGRETLRNNKLRVTEFGGDQDMIVGMDFFLAHRVFVANSQNRLYFTYTGGTFFNAAGKSKQAVDESGKILELPDERASAAPSDAIGLARRGMALAAQNKLEAGLADLDKAVELAPKDARFRYQRAGIARQMGKHDVADADLDAALAIDPNYGDALAARAVSRLVRRDREGAKVDVMRATQVIEPSSDLRFMLAGMLASLDDQPGAIEQWTLWIDAHPADSRRPNALNGRCWARALANVELPKALSDCNAAVRSMPKRQMALDSRGLVKLRMGDLVGAIADYDAALAIDAKSAWSLYGRGIVRLRKGDKAGGNADIAAAAKIAPRMPERAKRYGIAP